MNALKTDKGTYDYKKVHRWTKSKGPRPYSILDCDKIFVPIHQVRMHEEQCAMGWKNHDVREYIWT